MLQTIIETKIDIVVDGLMMPFSILEIFPDRVTEFHEIVQKILMLSCLCVCLRNPVQCVDWSIRLSYSHCDWRGRLVHWFCF